ncbi:MAG: Fic family protein [Verrucomicrobia bacterium]|nr:Fic family protein [Verrucomicrobiota bacterium]
MWNWELPDWPKFSYNPEDIALLERKFLLGMGKASAYLKSIDRKDYKGFVVEVLSAEGIGSAKIEGELLDREGLQSSIKKHFGLAAPVKKRVDKESQMADLLCNVYETFEMPLNHEMLYEWHTMLFKEAAHIADKGKYRTHDDTMQIVSNHLGSPPIFFEAPPSERVFKEMDAFIRWFNATSDHEPILGRVAIAHLYFENIHPFEDGNGRIGRALIEKMLSQSLGHPVLLSLSKLLEKRKRDYYAELERCNRTLDAGHWVKFFAEAVIQAHEEAMSLLYFIIAKSKMMSELTGQINERQMKVLLRMFEEGPDGFKGGLSAENYLKITKTSRATATRDLTDLVEKGALIKTGELRHTRYWLNLKN